MPDLDALYERHGPLLYAVALRMTGSPEHAVEVLAEVFRLLGSGKYAVERTEGVPASLLRAVRDTARARYDQTTPARVLTVDGSPGSLLQAVFFDGATVESLASAAGLTVGDVRARLCEGMKALRERSAGRGRP